MEGVSVASSSAGERPARRPHREGVAAEAQLVHHARSTSTLKGTRNSHIIFLSQFFFLLPPSFSCSFLPFFISSSISHLFHLIFYLPFHFLHLLIPYLSTSSFTCVSLSPISPPPPARPSQRQVHHLCGSRLGRAPPSCASVSVRCPRRGPATT